MENLTENELVAIEQLIVFWTSRDTYDNEAEWIDNVDGQMAEVASNMGMAFQSPLEDSYELYLSDIENDPEMVGHPDFDARGHSYGVGIYKNGELVERVYAPSESAAHHNAEMRLKEIKSE